MDGAVNIKREKRGKKDLIDLTEEGLQGLGIVSSPEQIATVCNEEISYAYTC